MRLNGTEYAYPVWLAPMAGYTDLSFRLLCREQGADAATTEMVSAKGLLYGAAATRALLRSEEADRPLYVQLFGREPALLSDAAALCADLLGDGLAGIDLNMGCPAHKITGNGEGSALMKEPALAGAIVSAVAGRIGLPVSVKFRSGWDEEHKNAVEFAKICEGSGAAMLTVHPRTRERMYAGRADWAVIAQVRAAVRIPVIGSGDIKSGGDALRMREETGCDGVAVGRAALGNPWVFSEIKSAFCGAAYTPPTDAERRAMALRLSYMTVAQKGPHAIVELRKHIAWFIRSVPGANALRVRINEAKTCGELAEILS